MIARKLSLESLYKNWEPRLSSPLSGYTLLMPVPGDLPVFLKIALEICSLQDQEHLYETLIIPDQWPEGLDENVQSILQILSFGPTRIIKLKPVDYMIIRDSAHPHIIHWLQFIRGTEAVRTTHALLHDADLFIPDPDFLKNHYIRCFNENLSCLGVEKTWDKWYEQLGFKHLVSTWELMFDVDWIKEFSPYLQRGHERIFNGEKHEFDLTLWPQIHTTPNRIGNWDKQLELIHFGYLVAAYRWFQLHSGPYEDAHFKILIIRLLIMVFDDSGWKCEVPSIEILKMGLTKSSNRVTYLKRSTRENYYYHRNILQRLIASKLFNAERTAIIEDAIYPFDKHFDYQSNERLSQVKNQL